MHTRDIFLQPMALQQCVTFPLEMSKLGSLTSFTYSNFGDLRQGARRKDFTQDFGKRNWYASRVNGLDTMITNNDPNLQIGSAYHQFDFLQNLYFDKINL